MNYRVPKARLCFGGPCLLAGTAIHLDLLISDFLCMLRHIVLASIRWRVVSLRTLRDCGSAERSSVFPAHA